MIQEVTTTQSPAAVLAAAKRFFTRRNPLYGAFPEQEGSNYITFRGQGGEELVIGVAPVEGGTLVRGSTYLFTQQVGRFLATLEPEPSTEEVIA